MLLNLSLGQQSLTEKTVCFPRLSGDYVQGRAACQFEKARLFDVLGGILPHCRVGYICGGIDPPSDHQSHCSSTLKVGATLLAPLWQARYTPRVYPCHQSREQARLNGGQTLLARRCEPVRRGG